MLHLKTLCYWYINQFIITSATKKKENIYNTETDSDQCLLYCHILFTVYSVDAERDKVISHGMEMNSPSRERQEEAASLTAIRQ